MQVPFVDLKIPTQQIKKDYLSAVNKFLQGGRFILTQEVSDFEKKWAKMIGTKYCVGVSCGADALYLALRALNIGVGDEVITQGNAYNASVTPILRVGAIPRFIDIDKDSLAINIKKIESKINKKTKAILPVHLYGQPSQMDLIMKIAKDYKLAVIEDCAQAHLAELKNKKVGSWGDVGAFSFYPTKNLGVFGEAGAITTNSKKIRDEIMALRDLGQVSKNQHKYLGYNMRLDVLQAICLNLKLKYLKGNNKQRQQAAAYYDKLITKANIPIQPIKKLEQGSNVYHLYPVQLLKGSRNKLREQLDKLGIQTAIHYPVLVYRQGFYKGRRDRCPITDKVCKHIFSLPLFIGITKRQQEYVIDGIKRIMD